MNHRSKGALALLAPCGSGTSEILRVLGGVAELTIYSVWDGPPTAGEIVIESAHAPDYAGEWAALEAISAPATEKVVATMVTGALGFLRVRVSTPLVDGTVAAFAVGHAE